jgi:hypothetical protein
MLQSQDADSVRKFTQFKLCLYLLLRYFYTSIHSQEMAQHILQGKGCIDILLTSTFFSAGESSVTASSSQLLKSFQLLLFAFP